jgi:hypothetical protein
VPIFQKKRKKNERETEREREKKQRKTKRQTKSQWLTYPENALVVKGKSADPKLPWIAGIEVGYPWPGGWYGLGFLWRSSTRLLFNFSRKLHILSSLGASLSSSPIVL